MQNSLRQNKQGSLGSGSGELNESSLQNLDFSSNRRFPREQ